MSSMRLLSASCLAFAQFCALLSIPRLVHGQDASAKGVVVALLKEAQKRQAMSKCDKWAEAQVLVNAAHLLAFGTADANSIDAVSKQIGAAIASNNCPTTVGVGGGGGGGTSSSEFVLSGGQGAGGVKCKGTCATAAGRDAIAFLLLDPTARDKLAKSLDTARQRQIGDWIKVNPALADDVVQLHPQDEPKLDALKDFVAKTKSPAVTIKPPAGRPPI